jgi:hypothetical protein
VGKAFTPQVMMFIKPELRDEYLAAGLAAARDPGQATRLRTNSPSFGQPESIWLMEEP